MKLVGSNTDASLVGVDELSGFSNFFVGSDRNNWRSKVPHFARIDWRNVYPGIDLALYGNQGQLEYDFVVAPGADPGIIRLSFEGMESSALDENGNLVLRVVGGELVQHAPTIYQKQGKTILRIAGGYLLEDDGGVAFRVDHYDASRPLIVDPMLSYSTYLGGSGSLDACFDIAVDSLGNSYVTGSTASTDFPTVNSFDPTLGGGQDVFVTKLDATGTALIYSTYLGGDSGNETGWGIAVDAAGNAYVAGDTKSTDFPTVNALQGIFGGGPPPFFGDAFVAKLDASGSNLLFSTYLGGSSPDNGRDIAIDSAGNPYVTGYTSSFDFPTANALQPALSGFGYDDAFIAKLNATGSSLVYSTYLGGGEDDEGRGIAVNGLGNAYLAGATRSSDFPTSGAFQPAFGGGACFAGQPCWDGFVVKLNANGAGPVFSTYLGGSSDDSGNGIAIDPSGRAYVTGGTDSSDFPTVNALQPVPGNLTDAFVTRLDAAGKTADYSTYLGASGYSDGGQAIAADSRGNAYVTGYTDSTDFPTLWPVQPTGGGVFLDAFVTRLNATGAALVYSTYLGGGSHYDQGRGIAVDATHAVYVAGSAESTDFPTVNPFDGTLGGSQDAFVARIVEHLNFWIASVGSGSAATIAVGGPATEKEERAQKAGSPNR